MPHTRPAPRALLLGALALLGALGTPARAQGSLQDRGTLGPAPVLTIGAAESGASRRVELTAGRSVIVDLPRDAKEVFVANPAVANAVVRSTRKVFVIGMADGATSIFIMDAEGRQITALDVTVARDLNLRTLRDLLGQSIPGGRFDVRSSGASVLLSGSVASSAEAQQAIDIANAFVGLGSGGGGAAAGGGGGPSGGVGGGARGAVINNLTVRNKDQVMLRVTVMEISRNVLKQFGISLNGNWSALNPVGALGETLLGGGTANAVNVPAAIPNVLTNGVSFPITGGTNASGQLQASIRGGGFSLQATLKALEQAGVSRILAEPTLTAISGEAAKFLAGGEYPVPQSAACTTAGGCIPGIGFKQYGVALSFTPVVLADNRISIRVATDVTEIDPQQNFNYVLNGGSVSVPGTRVRRSETTVELPSGAVMMTAGLIQQVNKQALTGLPGLINLPVLGALFRSRDYQRQETELMIMCTPYIARPMEPKQVARPDDNFVDTNDGQAVLLGQINRLYGRVGAAPLAGGYRGRVGFIVE
ncbi:type II and III secretion system protein family protein [Methylobacterium sp. NEAU 140]|uniref:type II and III secretion system protein family protein n=1 Tax=Methylobacterium sp. NEAU 140 TaxID=3064945 RepID=UPI002735236C|nr:type II and III secretion system protein family protein [Methylobacterium sp. NEAU 140]MDP4022788.1 type II and III secretion system protein family protein [Methylobacterium sp. NEAU 140]